MDLQSACDKKSLVEANVLFKVIRVLHTPLRQKYRCFLNSNWRVAVNVLIKVLKCGIPVARRHSAANAAGDQAGVTPLTKNVMLGTVVEFV